MKMTAALALALFAGVASGVNVMSALKRNHMNVNGPKYFGDDQGRYAWNDCGGMGASASNKIQTLTAKLANPGGPLPRKFMRNAGQDCADVKGSKGFEGNNGFEPPATVHARLCASLEADACTEDGCVMKDDKCVVDPEAHEYNRDIVFPDDQDLYTNADLALGRAEEVTHAGIVELKITGKDSGNDATRAADASEAFDGDMARQA